MSLPSRNSFSEQPELVKDDFQQHKTFESWVEEGVAIAKNSVYLNGELLVPRELPCCLPSKARLSMAKSAWAAHGNTQLSQRSAE
jgi:hypothetical protein